MAILTVNAGSSSVRLAAFGDDGHDRLAATHLTGAAARRDARVLLREFLGEHRVGKVCAISHRIVHGGPRLIEPRRLDGPVKAEIERYAPLAPLHNPIALQWIEACEEALGQNVPQVAAFDTAFFATLPDVAREYALPRTLCEKYGLRRYGFHGLAHQAMWRRWRALRPDVERGGRVISLQLGAGCSVAAIKDGMAVDTSMGFTPLEGLVMATRSGDVDAGLVTFVQRKEGLTPEQLERLLAESSGLQGIAGESDMQALLERTDQDATLAVKLYCYRIRKYIGAYFAVLGGVDAILLGGGVGEHAPSIRSEVLAGLVGLGIRLDDSANRAAVGTEARISPDGDRADVWVIVVDEAQALARAAIDVLSPSATAQGAFS